MVFLGKAEFLRKHQLIWKAEILETWRNPEPFGGNVPSLIKNCCLVGPLSGKKRERQVNKWLCSCCDFGWHVWLKGGGQIWGTSVSVSRDCTDCRTQVKNLSLSFIYQEAPTHSICLAKYCRAIKAEILPPDPQPAVRLPTFSPATTFLLLTAACSEYDVHLHALQSWS